jgi:hypothetical protein
MTRSKSVTLVHFNAQLARRLNPENGARMDIDKREGQDPPHQSLGVEFFHVVSGWDLRQPLKDFHWSVDVRKVDCTPQLLWGGSGGGAF